MPLPLFAMLLSLLAVLPLQAQTSPAPLPDAATLVRRLNERHDQLAPTLARYTYTEKRAIRRLNSQGQVKRTDSDEADIFFVNGHSIRHLLRKDGETLSPADQQKEQQRVQREVAKAEKTSPEQSMETNSIPFHRLLAILKFSPPRHAVLDGHEMIATDFIGNPDVPTHSRAENALRAVHGTMWVDTQYSQIRKLTGVFEDNYDIGLGVVTVSKGSSFVFDQTLVNNEIWLPQSIHIHILAKALLGLVGFRAEVQIDGSDYRRFNTAAEQQH